MEDFMKKIGKEFWMDIIKTILISLIISAIMILGLTLLIAFVPITDKILVLINQVIKVVSLLAAMLLCFKEKRGGIPKGLAVGLLYSLFSWLLFGLAENDFSFSSSDIVDIIFGTAIGLICGILAVMFGRKNKYT